jgi:methionyl-tRNA formyltransferase
MTRGDAPPEKIIFFGTPSFAVPSLQTLLEGPDRVVAVVTQPDRPRGRGQKKSPLPVKNLAREAGVPVLQPQNVKEDPFLEVIRGFGADLFVVVAYGRILTGALLAIPRHGAMNVHASLLPKHRGAAPISRAILEGETVTGVTTMMLDEGMDTGDILMQVRVPVGEDDTSDVLHDRLAAAGARLLRETVSALKQGTLLRKPQDHTQASYAPMIKKEDGRIDWKRSAVEIERRVRAFTAWPGAFTSFKGRVLKIYKAEVRQDGSGRQPGQVTWVGADFVEVGTGNGRLAIFEVQPEGGRRMAVREFLPGHAIEVGTELD